MDHALQKATELGVTRIVPLITERCNLRLDGERWDKKMEHWRGVVASACEQSGRTRLPELLPVQTLEAWCAMRASAPCALMLDPRAPQGLAGLAPHDAGYDVLVGPEGGLSPADLATASAAGFTGLRLGPRILRTETAGPAVIAALQARFGDLG
jgi:16S rRNA (uracil1498-N3)-methyltransferase